MNNGTPQTQTETHEEELVRLRAENTALKKEAEELHAQDRIKDLDIQVLKDTVKRLSFDGLTKLRRGDLMHGHMARVIRAMLEKPHAQQMLGGMAFEKLSREDQRDLNMLAVFLDLGYLSLFNAANYELGNKVLEALGEELCKRMLLKEGSPLVAGLNEGKKNQFGSPVMVPMHFAARSAGDEFFLCFVDDPQHASEIVIEVVKAMKMRHIDPKRVPLPPQVDYGSCSLAEALTAAAVWIQTQGRPASLEDVVTLVKQIMLGVSSERSDRAKTYSRVSLLAQIRRMGDHPILMRTIPHIVKGAHAISKERLDRIVAAAHIADIDTGKTEFDKALLDEGVRFATKELFDARTAILERVLREVGDMDGENYRMDLLISCAAECDTGRFIEKMRKKGN